MRIIAKKTIIDFYTKHAEAKIPLEDWYNKAMIAEWSCYADIKRDFNSVDAVGNGIRINHKTYTIIAMSEGKNFDTNEVEHLKLTLERASYGES